MKGLHLKSLRLPTREQERKWLFENDHSHRYSLDGVYRSLYPFYFFDKYESAPIFELEPITVLYGGNGSGKSTVLNVLAEVLKLNRSTPYNRTDFFSAYCALCSVSPRRAPYHSSIITSDDVFDRLISVRKVNQNIDMEREAIWKDKLNKAAEAYHNHSIMQLKGLDDYDRWSEYVKTVCSSTSSIIRERGHKNLESASNGETAIKVITDQITENGLYLLDEPENSLSPKFQLELKQFIEESARFFNCQFIIATHSPFLLSMNGAKIYNLDDRRVGSVPWTELENIKIYAKFFKEHEQEFIK